jgi:hypothetical protein
MEIIKSDKIVYFDVDETLVTFDQHLSHAGEVMHLECGSKMVRCWIMEKHVQAMREHAARGHAIVVWSAGGWEWAHTIVRALQLEELVDAVMCKPSWFYDDKTSSYFMHEKDRVYFYDNSRT